MSDPTTASRHPASERTTLVSPGSLICPRCGVVVGAGSRFCPACGAALAPPTEAEDHLIARLRHATQGEYDVLREIGHGGMAAVYLAWDRELARYVAIKVLLPELAHHPTMSQRFLQEARTAANLDDYPSVVRVYRAKEAQGLRYFVMKYIDGCSLEQLLRATGPLAPDLALHVIDQVALALQYAHERGVVHRDVKPGNILLDRSGGVVVTDFGIAKVAEAEQLTRTGIAIGTPHYMSPEQWRIEPLTPASDQYALGAVAYYLVTGDVPFDGTQYAIQEQHLRTEPPLLSTQRDGVPPAFDAVVRRMLAKAPGDLFPDLRSVSQALAAIPRDAAPVLRERLSRLIPAVNTPGVREVPPSDVPLPHPHVAVERRAARPPDPATTVLASRGAGAVSDRQASAPPPADEPVGAPSAPSLDMTTTLQPLPPATAPNAPPDAAPDTPPIAEPVTPDADGADERAPDGLPDRAPARSAPAVAAPAHPAPLLEGPITRQYPARRVGPWLAAAAVLATLVGGGVALWSRAGAAAGERAAGARGGAAGGATDSTARSAALTAAPAAPVPASSPSADSSGVLAAGAPGAADTAGTAASDTAASDPSAPPGAPAALLVVGGPSRGTLTLPSGDSVRLRARVNDARGTRLVGATVQWASSDPAHIAFRNGWAVALAPGGPVAVTATSGALARSVRLVVAPRPSITATSRSGVARPTPAELRAEVQRFVAALDNHDYAEVSRRLAPRAVDGSSAREFVGWLAGTDGLAADAPALGDASDEGSRARVAFRVPLRWRGGGGSLGDRGRTDVTFWMTLAHDDQGWHGGEVLLGGRVAP